MSLQSLPPTRIKFGTDGWRAIIGEDYTFDNVRACAASAAMYLQRHGLAERGMVIGYDARFASADFAAAAAEVVAAHDLGVTGVELAGVAAVGRLAVRLLDGRGVAAGRYAHLHDVRSLISLGAMLAEHLRAVMAALLARDLYRLFPDDPHYRRLFLVTHLDAGKLMAGLGNPLPTGPGTVHAMASLVGPAGAGGSGTACRIRRAAWVMLSRRRQRRRIGRSHSDPCFSSLRWSSPPEWRARLYIEGLWYEDDLDWVVDSLMQDPKCLGNLLQGKFVGDQFSAT